MDIDVLAARSFLAGHGRQLDRRRYALLSGDGGAEAVLAAVDAYRNPDGGYGWGLEPDLRDGTSQPGGALHAFEVFGDLGESVTPHAAELCDWLAAVSLPDGGLPFALPITDPAGCAPFWVAADPASSSLQITSVVAATAHRVAAHDPAVAAHPWLARAIRYCLDSIAALDSAPHAIVMAFAVRFLDAVFDTHPEAVGLLKRLGAYIPADGLVPVDGGANGETMRPLDFAPLPDRPARTLFAAETVAADLDRLASGQQSDGGWCVDFDSYSPAAAAEWRGYQTVSAISILRANSRI